MKSSLTVLLLLLSAAVLSQVGERVLAPKIGFYTYQNVGLKGGLGIKTYPFTNYRQVGCSAGYFYYAGDMGSRIDKVIDQYQGFEIGLSTLSERYHNRSGGVKKAFRGLGINAFYTRNGLTNRTDWHYLKACGGSQVGPSVHISPNKNEALGVELYYKIARGYENDRALVLFSFEPGVRLVKSESEYSVECDPTLVDIANPNEKVSNMAFPFALKLQMEVFIKYKKENPRVWPNW